MSTQVSGAGESEFFRSKAHKYTIRKWVSVPVGTAARQMGVGGEWCGKDTEGKY